jgi:hypothetical protein
MSKKTKKTKKSNHTKLNKKKTLNSKPIKTELEYEAKFLDINRYELVKKIKSLGAILKQPNTFYRRSMFGLCDVKRGYVRVRDEGDKTTLTAKIYKNPDYPEEFELQFKDGFEKGKAFLEALNLNEKAYHETMREKWHLNLDKKLNNKDKKSNNKNNNNNICEIAFDCIPGIPMYVEVECKTESNLKKAIKLLDLDKYEKRYGAYGKTFVEYYGMAETEINNDIKSLTFKNIEKELKPYIHKNEDLLTHIAKQHLETYKKLKIH